MVGEDADAPIGWSTSQSYWWKYYSQNSFIMAVSGGGTQCRQTSQCSLLPKVRFASEAPVQKRLLGSAFKFEPVSHQESCLLGISFLRVHRS